MVTNDDRIEALAAELLGKVGTEATLPDEGKAKSKDLSCRLDYETGEVVCPVTEEEWAELQEQEVQPKRVVFEIRPVEKK